MEGTTFEERGRNLLDELKSLIFELVTIENDVAKLDISNRMQSVRRVKRAMLLHIKTSTEFKKKIEAIRVEIVNTKSN